MEISQRLVVYDTRWKLRSRYCTLDLSWLLQKTWSEWVKQVILSHIYKKWSILSDLPTSKIQLMYRSCFHSNGRIDEPSDNSHISCCGILLRKNSEKRVSERCVLKESKHWRTFIKVWLPPFYEEPPHPGIRLPPQDPSLDIININLEFLGILSWIPVPSVP